MLTHSYQLDPCTSMSNLKLSWTKKTTTSNCKNFNGSKSQYSFPPLKIDNKRMIDALSKGEKKWMADAMGDSSICHIIQIYERACKS